MAIIICLFYRLSRSGEHMPNVGFFATSHPIKACFLCFALASSGCWANTLQMSIEGAESGDVLEQYNLALAYANGDGVMQDYEVAADWYTRAAAQGYIDAQYNLALAYINGEGVKHHLPLRGILAPLTINTLLLGQLLVKWRNCGVTGLLGNKKLHTRPPKLSF